MAFGIGRLWDGKGMRMHGIRPCDTARHRLSGADCSHMAMYGG